MTRTYKRKPGSRQYADYDAERLEACLQDIRSGIRTQRSASQYYNIPRSTIINKLKTLRLSVPSKKYGHPTVFTSEEEQSFVAHIDKLANFGFPVTDIDLRYSIKCYLNKLGRSVTCFKNNLPGPDWAASFRKRHPILTVRVASNIKRVRAAIDDYFDNLESVISNVPDENIWNYDETNLRDDPGASKVICKRGQKYVERIMESTKSCISLMFCGNGCGDMIPPYVVYKSEHLWTTWTEGGPAGCRYNRTKSGWFDMATFEDWFMTTLLPRLKKLPGVKVVIGDNLSSHINLEVLKTCEENNIRFVCLPPNATHLTQPLDVTYYGPMKREWRKILTSWKEGNKSLTSLPKDQFPKLLKQLVDFLYVEKKTNMISGFKKTGIIPLDRTKIKERLPQHDLSSPMKRLIGDSFMNTLAEKRKDVTKGKPTQKRKKLDVPAGKSVCSNLFDDSSENEIDFEDASTSTPKPKKGSRPTKQKPESDSEDSTSYSVHDNSASDDGSHLSATASESEASDEDVNTFGFEPIIEKKKPALDPESLKNTLKEGDFVIVMYERKHFPGLVIKLPIEGELGPTVDCMSKTSKSWKWPDKKDVLLYEWAEIKAKISPPKLLKRGHFNVPEMADYYE
jgi:hypothetical protein